MKDSDLRREKFKKGVIVSGIGAGASASTAGVAYAATRAFGVGLPEADIAPAEDESEYVIETEAASQSDDADTTPVFTVNADSAQPTPVAVTLLDDEDYAVDEVPIDAESVMVDSVPVSFDLDEDVELASIEANLQPYDALAATAEQSGNFFGADDLVEAYANGAGASHDEFGMPEIEYDGSRPESLCGYADPMNEGYGEEEVPTDDFMPIGF